MRIGASIRKVGVRAAGAATGPRTGPTTRRYTAAVINWTPQPIAFTVGPLAWRHRPGAAANDPAPPGSPAAVMVGEPASPPPDGPA